MKREVLLISLLLMQPAYAEDDIGIKTGGYNSEEVQLKPAITDEALQALQPVPNVPAEAPKTPTKKLGFWKKFHPDHIEKYHPKLNKGWNTYMFMYEHGGRQTLDVTSKVAQIAFPFVAR